MRTKVGFVPPEVTPGVGAASPLRCHAAPRAAGGPLRWHAAGGWTLAAWRLISVQAMAPAVIPSDTFLC